MASRLVLASGVTSLQAFERLNELEKAGRVSGQAQGSAVTLTLVVGQWW